MTFIVFVIFNGALNLIYFATLLIKYHKIKFLSCRNILFSPLFPLSYYLNSLVSGTNNQTIKEFLHITDIHKDEFLGKMSWGWAPCVLVWQEIQYYSYFLCHYYHYPMRYPLNATIKVSLYMTQQTLKKLYVYLCMYAVHE